MGGGGEEEKGRKRVKCCQERGWGWISWEGEGLRGERGRGGAGRG